MIQRFRPMVVGRGVRAVICVWFLVARVGLGPAQSSTTPPSCARYRRRYGAQSLRAPAGTAFVALSAPVVLTVDRRPSLYAYMGHVGRPPIRARGFLLGVPALIPNYRAKGALILRDPSADLESPFFLMSRLEPAPDCAAGDRGNGDRVRSGHIFRRVSRHPPGRRLGFLPRPRYPPHQQRRPPESGRLYVPAVQLAVYVAPRLALVIGFRFPSAHLPSPYGVAVNRHLAERHAAVLLLRGGNRGRKPLGCAIPIAAAGFLTAPRVLSPRT